MFPAMQTAHLGTKPVSWHRRLWSLEAISLAEGWDASRQGAWSFPILFKRRTQCISSWYLLHQTVEPSSSPRFATHRVWNHSICLWAYSRLACDLHAIILRPTDPNSADRVAKRHLRSFLYAIRSVRPKDPNSARWVKQHLRSLLRPDISLAAYKPV